VGGELQLTDAIAVLLQSEPVYGRVFSEGRYDIGKKMGFLQANIELGLEHAELGPQLRDYIADLARKRGLA
jgi:UTP--glucose-1-phosphate uridylyltransferase